MPDLTPQLTTFDEQIATVRENIRELLEQQPRIRGAADDDLVTRRIADQEAKFEILTK